MMMRAREAAMGRLAVALILASLALLPRPGMGQAPTAPVALIQIEGAITPVTVRLIAGAVERAQAQRAPALVLQLDTPGGLERSMRSIVQTILNAEIPVIVYVAPTGARAASAGVFITMAGHLAAMAPATNIGAAHPVAVGGNVDKETLRKIESDAAAFARSIAADRGRNADWAEKAVRSSVSATEREAVRLKVVDLVAESVPDLLAKVHGRTVKTVRGPITLSTKEAVVRPIEVRFRDRFLALITDPNVAYILMMVGMLGLFFELSNPGVILPGIIGGISLILAFFAFQSLPINWAGLLLILFGVVLLLAEIKVVSHGVLTIGGVIAMVLGSLMLYETPETGFRISWWVILPTVGATAGLVAWVVSAGLKALYRRPSTGPGDMIGRTGVARMPLDPEGQVQVGGELWRAVVDDGPVAAGEPVRVTAVDGLTLTVVRAAGPSPAPEGTRRAPGGPPPAPGGTA
jgi:membrane-bound serine protease (ClpP class)